MIGNFKIIRYLYDKYEQKLNSSLDIIIDSTKIQNGWSVVIITDGNSTNCLTESVRSIDEELGGDSSSEIIIVGPPGYRLAISDITIQIRYIDYKELNWYYGWITRKKNIGVLASKFNKIVLAHDYVVFEKGWKNGWNKFGEIFDVCMTKFHNQDGSRWRDWITWDYPGIGRGLLPYDVECSKYQYISGTYFIVKRDFFIRNLLDEKFRWGEGEDVEWSLRVREKTIFKFNPHSSVRCAKLKSKEEPPYCKSWAKNTELLGEMYKNNK
jgi:hypothetical protein